MNEFATKGRDRRRMDQMIAFGGLEPVVSSRIVKT